MSKGMYEHICRHGQGRAGKQSATYRAWANMKARCKNKNNPYYGGKGIDYDPRWEIFDNFWSDMGTKPDGMTLERLDNSKGYWPDNCKWATYLEQNRNRSISKKFVYPNEYPPNSEPGE